MSKTIRRIALAAAFVVVLLLCIQTLGVLFQDQSVCFFTYNAPKKEQDKIDVVTVGSSHAFCTVYPQYLYDEYGYSAWNMSSREVGIPNMYWGEREIVDTVEPDALLIELMMMTEDSRLSSYTRSTMVRDMSMFSPNHWRAFFDLNDGAVDWTAFFEFFFDQHQLGNVGRESAQVLARDSRVSRRKGANYLQNHQAFSRDELPVYADTDPDRDAVPQENLDYLQKTLDYAEEHGVDVLMFLAPDPRPEMYAGKRAVVELVEEMGYPVLDFNEEALQEEIGFDVEQHMADGNHVNRDGALLINQYLGDYMEEHFSLEDHRGQEGYEAWAEEAEDYRIPGRLERLKDTDSGAEYLALLDRLGDEYAVTALAEGSWNDALGPELRSALEEFGMELPEDGSRFCFMKHAGESWTGTRRNARLDSIPILLDAEENLMDIGGDSISRDDDGITLSLLDLTRGKVLSTVVLRGEKAYH